MPIRVAYQGEHGAYSEQAVLTLFKSRTDVLPLPHVTFSSVFDSVTSNSADCALVPIENSLGGSIHDNYDLLVSHDVIISAEIEFQVHHCLVALPSQSITSIHTVMSHPQALAQCEDFITNLHLKAEKQYDTAGSAKLIRDRGLTGTAAIASSLAADVYGLSVLASHIEDDPNNFTRFLLIHKPSQPAPAILPSSPTPSPTPSPTVHKTSIVFALKDEPGVLFKALSVFALRDIHLSKIESRPGKRLRQLLSAPSNEVRLEHVGGAGAGTSRVFKYLFYLDLLAHAEEPRAQNALNHLREIAPFVRVLGSYPSSSALSSSMVELRPSVPPLTVGIVGFGTFGQFLARAFIKHGWRVVTVSRTDYTAEASAMSVTYCSTYDSFLSHRPDIIVLSVSILSFEQTVHNFPWTTITHPCLIVDVLSVKIHPKTILTKLLPPNLSILSTHPMFGPDSGKYSWKGLPFMYDSLRPHAQLTPAFLALFQSEGCRMLPMSCELHDAYAAGSQFITHTTGRVLAQLGCESTPINTRGYSQLLEVIGNTCRDSLDLYRGLFQFNPHSRTQLDGFERAFQSIKSDLLNTDPTAPTPPAPTFTTKPLYNPRVTSMNESKTVQVTDLAKKLQSQGHRIISLSVGEPIDIPTPQPVIDAACRALQTGCTKYTPVAGLLDLRKKIAEKLKVENNLIYSTDEIVVSNGAKQCILQAIMALTTPDDEVIIPAPYWVSYPDMCTLSGARPVIVHTVPDTGYVMTGEQLRAVLTAHTKLVILCSPSNPTGGVYSKAALEELVGVLAEWPHVWVLSDEIYEHLIFDGASHVSIAALPGMRERTITVNGFSKCFSMTGFRLGYAAAPLEVAQLCNKIQGQITSCASSISQMAGIAALSMDSGQFRSDMVTKLKHKRDFVLAILRSIDGVTIETPKGAFYAMPDVSAYFGRKTKRGETIDTSDALCVWLLSEYRVALVPGSAFGAPQTVRISYASDEDEVRAGVTGLKRCLEELLA